jgi:hypothetical protein
MARVSPWSHRDRTGRIKSPRGSAAQCSVFRQNTPRRGSRRGMDLPQTANPKNTYRAVRRLRRR